ncbi:hypothetical protein MO973_21390 [Paenibacillus sp. TRM 82003]|nr:hypothetical protein [Paenibacillus sp. TRM 82003]
MTMTFEPVTGDETALQLECTLFFERNPYALETVPGLSKRLGRSAADLALVVERMAKLSILERIGEGDRAIYCYRMPDLQYGLELK